MKNGTMADVAEHVKNSRSKVSRYLNKRCQCMSEATRKRIKATIDELNYHLHGTALSQKHRLLIGQESLSRIMGSSSR